MFIIIGEGLTSLMRNACSLQRFQPFGVYDNMDFDLLQFTDNTIILGLTFLENLWTIKVILRRFELAYGLSVNSHKINILGFNVDLDFLLNASNFLSCVISSFPFTFFGLPVGVNLHKCNS